MVNVEVHCIAGFEARCRLEDLKLDHDLDPLKHVVFLEKLEVRKDIFLDSLSVLVSQIEIVPDKRVLQYKKEEKTVQEDYIVIELLTTHVYISDFIVVTGWITKVRAELVFFAECKLFLFQLYDLRIRLSFFEWMQDVFVVNREEIKITEKTVHHSEVYDFLTSYLEVIEAVI